MSEKSCEHDLLNPIRKGRARYHCSKCGADISMDVIYLAMAMEDADELSAVIEKHEEGRR
jgi:adenosyl cobinamide kinase/adenosyl cobinamide phosphate guanylyltransferase